MFVCCLQCGPYYRLVHVLVISYGTSGLDVNSIMLLNEPPVTAINGARCPPEDSVVPMPSIY